jgi:5-methylcytosine-specific restriction endonuclease McrA
VSQKTLPIYNHGKEKRCSKCKETKPLSDFYKRAKDSEDYLGHCKVCVNKYNKEYFEEHREQAAKRLRNYRKNNHEKVKENDNNYRHRKRANGGNVTLQEWKELKEKYGNKCLRCKKENVPLTKDHIVPVSLGGAHVIDNIQPLCRSCNALKHTKIIDYRPF